MKVTSDNKYLVMHIMTRLHDKTRYGRLKWQLVDSRDGVNKFNAAVPGGGRVEVLVPPAGPQSGGTAVVLYGLGDEKQEVLTVDRADGVDATLVAMAVVDSVLAGEEAWLQKMRDALA